MNGGRVVGWAAFHRVPRNYTVSVDYVCTETVTVSAKSEKEALRKAYEQVREEYGEDTMVAYNATLAKEQ